MGNPYLVTALPLQAQAHRAIAQHFNPDISMELATKVFAHPAFPTISFEGLVSPFFLLGCKIKLFHSLMCAPVCGPDSWFSNAGAMFPFVIQMSEVVNEKELKLRQALQAIGLHDVSYWLAWHIFQSSMSFIFGFFIWVFGMIFQLRIFLKNGVHHPCCFCPTCNLLTDGCMADFGIIFLTFWLFGQAMV